MSDRQLQPEREDRAGRSMLGPHPQPGGLRDQTRRLGTRYASEHGVCDRQGAVPIGIPAAHRAPHPDHVRLAGILAKSRRRDCPICRQDHLQLPHLAAARRSWPRLARPLGTALRHSAERAPSSLSAPAFDRPAGSLHPRRPAARPREEDLIEWRLPAGAAAFAPT
jgi:hypothetical protein